MLRRPGVREFRYDLKKYGLKKYGNYRNWAKNLCTEPEPPLTLEELIECRTRELEHLCLDPKDGDPRGSFLLAAWESVFGYDMPLTSKDVGFDPSKP